MLKNLASLKHRRPRVAVNTAPQDPIPAVLALCDAAASKIGPPVRGAEPLWSCVEALRAASNGDFELGAAVERELFSRVSDGLTPADKIIACCRFCVGLWVLSQEQFVVWGVAHATCVFFFKSCLGVPFRTHIGTRCDATTRDRTACDAVVGVPLFPLSSGDTGNGDTNSIDRRFSASTP